MKKTDRHEPTLLGKLVAGARKDLVRAGGCPLDAHTWKQTFGERIAARSQPDQLRDGVLTLRVASAVWAQELSLLSSTIIERLAPRGFVVRSIRCKVASLESAPKPTAMRRPRIEPPTVELPSDLAQQLDQIGDTDLRTSIETAARAQLQMRANRKTEARIAREPRRK